MAAADELEALFDRRLELEAQKLKKAMAERDDEQFKLEEQMRKREAVHEVGPFLDSSAAQLPALGTPFFGLELWIKSAAPT